MTMKIRNYMVMTLLSITMFACKKEVAVTYPLEVTTNQITEVEWTTATCGGQISYQGGSVVAFRGVVWGTEPNPTVNLKTKTEDGRGLGQFVSKLIDLQPGTKYYVRAYGINSTDTIYGEQVAFTTSSWTPKRMENLWDWWNSQHGISNKGNFVDEWYGVNGTELESGNEYNKGMLESKDEDWGNQPSVVINPYYKPTDCGYYTKLNQNKTSKTILMVCKILNSHKNVHNTIIAVNTNANPRLGIWGYTNYSFMFFNSKFSYKYGGEQFQDQTYQFIRITYDRDKGYSDYYIDQIPNFHNKSYTYQSTPGDNFVGGFLSLGYYFRIFGKTPKMSVVELLFIDGIPSDSELTTYGKYLKYKYKL